MSVDDVDSSDYEFSWSLMHIQSNIIYNSSNWELEHEWTVNKNVELKNPNSVISEPEKEIDDYDDELLLD